MKKKMIEQIPFMAVDGKAVEAAVLKGEPHDTLIIDMAAGAGSGWSDLRRERARFCLTSKDYAVYWPMSGRWQALSLRTILSGERVSWGTVDDNNIPSASRETSMRIFSFLGKEPSGKKYAKVWMKAVCDACGDIQSERRDAVAKRREERLQARCDSLLPIPKGFLSFAEKVGRGEDTFTWWPYNEDGTRKLGKGVCSACGNESVLVKTEIPRSGKKLACPVCGKHVVVRKSNYAAKDSRKHLSSEASFIQKTKDGRIVVRYFTVNAVRTARGADVEEPVEVVRDFLDPKTKKVQTDYHLESNWTKDCFWSDANLTYAAIPYGHGSFYVRSLLKGFFKGTAWEYCQLETLVRKVSKVSIIGYLRGYLLRPDLEMLVKGGMPRLAAHYGSGWAWSLGTKGRVWDRLHISQATFQAVKDHDPSYEELSWFMRAEKKGEKCDLSLARWAEKHHLQSGFRYYASDFILDHMSLTTMRNYVRKQARKAHMPEKQVLKDWLDYVSMGGELIGRDQLAFDTILRPKDLHTAHNEFAERLALKRARDAEEWAAQRERDAKERERAAKEAAERRAAELRANFPNVEEVYKSISDKYAFSNGSVSIVVPKTAAEVIEDGRLLRHCVGSSPDRYLARINAETTYILFLRKADALDLPWVTLEVEPGGTIEQSRTAGNTYFDLEKEGLGDFISDWQDHITDAMDEEDEALATQSQVLRAINLRDLRQREERVRGGREQGQLLADVLESNLRETADSEQEAKLIMRAFGYELLPVAARVPEDTSAAVEAVG